MKRIGRGKYLREDAADAFFRMALRAQGDGINLRVRSAHRSRAQQARLYRRYLSGRGHPAARPGSSRHELGVAIDVRLGRDDSLAYAWLRKNAREFGFRQAIRDEPWHWEFHGIPEPRV